MKNMNFVATIIKTDCWVIVLGEHCYFNVTAPNVRVVSCRCQRCRKCGTAEWRCNMRTTCLCQFEGAVPWCIAAVRSVTVQYVEWKRHAAYTAHSVHGAQYTRHSVYTAHTVHGTQCMCTALSIHGTQCTRHKVYTALSVGNSVHDKQRTRHTLHTATMYTVHNEYGTQCTRIQCTRCIAHVFRYVAITYYPMCTRRYKYIVDILSVHTCCSHFLCTLPTHHTTNTCCAHLLRTLPTHYTYSCCAHSQHAYTCSTDYPHTTHTLAAHTLHTRKLAGANPPVL